MIYEYTIKEYQPFNIGVKRHEPAGLWIFREKHGWWSSENGTLQYEDEYGYMWRHVSTSVSVNMARRLCEVFQV